MKLKSVSGFTCYVTDLAKTIDFYEVLGFQFRNRASEHATAYLNWYSIDFVAAGMETKPEFIQEAQAGHRGAGIYINLSVDDVDEFYKGLIEKGLKPSTEPRDWPWGNREFVIRDPDGYKLVIFKRK